MKPTMIRIGNFFFKYRNKLFPLIILVLFALQPPSETLLSSKYLASIKDWVAMLIAISGLALRGLVIGYAYIKRGGMNKQVYAENLVTEGLFGVCRNPLYVGNVLIYVGVFMLHGAPLIMLSGIAAFLFIYQCIVYAEEAYLEEKFGEGYKNYCRDVSRWGINLRRFKASTEGMSFNFGRAIQKDYSTIATTFIMLAVTEIYKQLATSEGDLSSQEVRTLFLLILMIGLWAGFIRFLKKRASKQSA